MSSDPSPLPPDSSRRKRIAVIGGGITALAAAHRLTTLDPTVELTLYEAGGKLGGILQTERRDGYLIERSADSFVTNIPWALDLCRELGIDGELLPTDAARRKALIVRNGKLHPVPAGFQLMTPSQLWPLARSPLLSLGGKLRVLKEYFVPRRSDKSDESLESFVVRRLGREAFDRLVQPLVSGIFTADPAKLSMRAALPKFVELEEKYGSLIKAARKAGGGEASAQRDSSGARYSLFTAPRDGMGRIVEALAARLPAGSVRLNSPVTKLEYFGSHWQVITSTGREPGVLTRADSMEDQLEAATPLAKDTFDGAIVAVGAPLASRILADVDTPLAEDLGRMEYAGASIAVSGYKLSQIENPLNAFGFVVPEVERRQILAASFSSRKFPGRAPDDCVLIRTFLGGALQPELVDLSDEEIRRIVAKELGELLGARGEPQLFQVVRWHGAMPQYHLGHVDLVERIQKRAAGIPGLALAGNAYEGVGVPQCIRSGRFAAERLLQR